MRVLRRPFEMIWEGTVSASSSVKTLAMRIYRLVIKPNPQLIQRQNIARLNKKIQQLKPEAGPPAKRRPMQQTALPGQPATETPTVSDRLKKYFPGGHAEFETALKDLVHTTIERRVHSQIKDYPLARLSDNEVVKLLKVPTLKQMVQEKNTDSLTKFRDHLQKHFDLIRKLSAAGGSFPPEEVRRDLPLLLQGQTHEEVKNLVKEEFDAFGLTGDLDTHLTALFTNTYTNTDENVLSTLLMILLKKRLEQMLENVETLTTGDWKALVKERINSVTDYLCLLIGKRMEQLIDYINLRDCVDDTLKLAANDVEQRRDYLPKLVESYHTLCSASGYSIPEGSAQEKKERLLLLLETEELKPELALHLSLFAMTVKRDKQTKERFFRLLANHLLNQLIAQETPDGSFYIQLLEPKSDALQLFTYEALRLLLPKEAYTAKTLFTHITSGLLPKALQERLKALEEGTPLYRAIDIAGRGLIAKQLAKGLEKGFDKLTEPHKLKKVLATKLLHKANRGLKLVLYKQLIRNEGNEFLSKGRTEFEEHLKTRMSHHQWQQFPLSTEDVNELWEYSGTLIKIQILEKGRSDESLESLKESYPEVRVKRFLKEKYTRSDENTWLEELKGKSLGASWSDSPANSLVTALFNWIELNGAITRV
ncbi:MAG: hypothetical protein KDK65_03965, partial [Chlamydiia bacterium]|nr:hypothetical protein [Chlamydiia bacterium]